MGMTRNLELRPEVAWFAEQIEGRLRMRETGRSGGSTAVCSRGDGDPIVDAMTAAAVDETIRGMSAAGVLRPHRTNVAGASGR